MLKVNEVFIKGNAFLYSEYLLKYIPCNPSKAACVKIFREKGTTKSLLIHKHAAIQPPEKQTVLAN